MRRLAVACTLLCLACTEGAMVTSHGVNASTILGVNALIAGGVALVLFLIASES